VTFALRPKTRHPEVPRRIWHRSKTGLPLSLGARSFAALRMTSIRRRQTRTPRRRHRHAGRGGCSRPSSRSTRPGTGARNGPRRRPIARPRPGRGGSTLDNSRDTLSSQYKTCCRRDSNPHVPGSRPGASCQLGYRSDTKRHNATRGIRTHTTRILRPVPPASWATVATFRSGSCRSRTCQACFHAPRFSRPVPAPMGSELPKDSSRYALLTSHFSPTKSTTGFEPVRAKVAAWPPATGTVLTKTKMGAAGLEPAKPGGARFTVWCDCRSATHPRSRLVRESNPCLRLDRAS
jgi:hypothetical protein